MAKKILSKTGDADSKRTTEMGVDGDAGQVVPPPVEVERPVLKYLLVASMVLLGLLMYTLMLITSLPCTISDPCLRQEVGRFLMRVYSSMSALAAMVLFVYMMRLG